MNNSPISRVAPGAIVKTYNNQSFQNTWKYKKISGTNDFTLYPIKYDKTLNVIIPHDLTVYGTIYGTLYVPSDLMLKNNVENLSIDTTLIQKLMELKPKKYTYKGDKEQKEHVGFIAQDVSELFPNLVGNIVGTDIKTVNYIEFIPILLLKIKDLQAQIDILNNKII
jgi:hypothetical protein